MEKLCGQQQRVFEFLGQRELLIRIEYVCKLWMRFSKMGVGWKRFSTNEWHTFFVYKKYKPSDKKKTETKDGKPQYELRLEEFEREFGLRKKIGKKNVRYNSPLATAQAEELIAATSSYDCSTKGPDPRMLALVLKKVASRLSTCEQMNFSIPVQLYLKETLGNILNQAPIKSLKLCAHIMSSFLDIIPINRIRQQLILVCMRPAESFKRNSEIDIPNSTNYQQLFSKVCTKSLFLDNLAISSHDLWALTGLSPFQGFENKNKNIGIIPEQDAVPIPITPAIKSLKQLKLSRLECFKQETAQEQIYTLSFLQQLSALESLTLFSIHNCPRLPSLPQLKILSLQFVSFADKRSEDSQLYLNLLTLKWQGCYPFNTLCNIIKGSPIICNLCISGPTCPYGIIIDNKNLQSKELKEKRKEEEEWNVAKFRNIFTSDRFPKLCRLDIANLDRRLHLQLGILLELAASKAVSGSLIQLKISTSEAINDSHLISFNDCLLNEWDGIQDLSIVNCNNLSTSALIKLLGKRIMKDLHQLDLRGLIRFSSSEQQLLKENKSSQLKLTTKRSINKHIT